MVAVVVAAMVAALMLSYTEAAPQSCRVNGAWACTATPTSTPVVTITDTPTVTPTPTPTASPTPTPTPEPTATTLQPKRWPKRTAAAPEVPVYYGGQGFSAADVLAMQRAMALVNATGIVRLLDMGSAVADAPCGQNYYYANFCLIPNNFYWLQTGQGGFYPGPDTSVQYLRATSTWVDTTVDTWAAEQAALRWNVLSPDGTCCGITTQDWLDRVFCHEMMHVVGLPESTDLDTPSCLNNNAQTPSAVDIALLHQFYDAVDGWGWPEGPQ